ncbi:hypothetical protein I79_004772 [Cricetulus griseus]|uniref:Uncharacterized protein n=1 Tax=Cricetulus griseus TaxID=10029 RepID=G3H3F7_CRIGR|nr:hypothetical protein I79_004772 [Cricetulus griseus]
MDLPILQVSTPATSLSSSCSTLHPSREEKSYLARPQTHRNRMDWTPAWAT